MESGKEILMRSLRILYSIVTADRSRLFTACERVHCFVVNKGSKVAGKQWR